MNMIGGWEWRAGWSMDATKYYGTTKFLQDLLVDFRGISGVRYGESREWR
jgi:hypothetical protein